MPTLMSRPRIRTRNHKIHRSKSPGMKSILIFPGPTKPTNVQSRRRSTLRLPPQRVVAERGRPLRQQLGHLRHLPRLRPRQPRRPPQAAVRLQRPLPAGPHPPRRRVLRAQLLQRLLVLPQPESKPLRVLDLPCHRLAKT